AGGHLHPPLPGGRLRLPGQADRRPAGAPARPLPDPRHQRPGRSRPALQRDFAAEAGARPRPRRVHRRDLGIPLPAAALYLPGSLMPKLSDLLVPAPLRKTPKPGGSGGPKPPAPKDVKSNPPQRPTDYGRLGEKTLEAPTEALAWVDQRMA